MSDWEKRPLRQTQVHYAALDAVVLVGVAKKLEEIATSKPDGEQMTLEKLAEPLTIGMEEEKEGEETMESNPKKRVKTTGAREKLSSGEKKLMVAETGQESAAAKALVKEEKMQE